MNKIEIFEEMHYPKKGEFLNTVNSFIARKKIISVTTFQKQNTNYLIMVVHYQENL